MNVTASDFKFKWHQGITRSNLPLRTKQVAYALWEFSSPEGGSMYPGVVRLMYVTGLSEPTVKRHLKILRDGHWIVRTAHASHAANRRADEYAMAIPFRWETRWEKLNDPLPGESDRDQRSDLRRESVKSNRDQNDGLTEIKIASDRDQRSDLPTGINTRYLTSGSVSSETDLSSRTSEPLPLPSEDDALEVEEWLEASMEKMGKQPLTGSEWTTVLGMSQRNAKPQSILNKLLYDRNRNRAQEEK